MGSEENVNENTQRALEFLLQQEATVDEVAAHLGRHVRTAYRAIEDVKELVQHMPGYRLVRTGNQGAYTYSVLQE